MSCKVLIVEDEIFVAIEVESVVRELGLTPIGIAPDSRHALRFGKAVDIALVDLNLHDGPTGVDVGRRLAAGGATVMFMTANPSQLGDGIPGAIGVMPKPVNDQELKAAIKYVAAIHQRERVPVQPPRRLRLFEFPSGGQVAAQPTG